MDAASLARPEIDFNAGREERAIAAKFARDRA
jgi:hypothetical protein